MAYKEIKRQPKRDEEIGGKCNKDKYAFDMSQDGFKFRS